MSRMNSVVARFSGTVAYQDGSKNIFHAQAEAVGTKEAIWSVNEIVSQETISDVVADATLNAAIAEFAAGWTFTPNPDARPISDMVVEMMFHITTDVGQLLPVGAIYERGAFRLTAATFADSVAMLAGVENSEYYSNLINTMMALLGGA